MGVFSDYFCSYIYNDLEEIINQMQNLESNLNNYIKTVNEMLSKYSVTSNDPINEYDKCKNIIMCIKT